MLFEPAIAPWNSHNIADFGRSAHRIPRARNREFDIREQGILFIRTAKELRSISDRRRSGAYLPASGLTWLVCLILVEELGLQHQQREAFLLVQHLFGHGDDLSSVCVT
jgi:hypothetical protein